MKTIFSHANVVDVLAGKILPDQRVLVEDGLIQAIGPDLDMAGAEVVDLGGRYLSPGFFNCHTHLTCPFIASPAEMKRSHVYFTLYSLENLATYIKTGVTFVRDVGDMDFITVDIRDAIRSGLIKMAPDMVTTGRPICMTGGSTWNIFGIQADGEDECRKTARLIIRSKVDWLKLMATGGTATLGNRCAAEQLTEGELRAAVEEAHKAGIKVSCHAQGLEGAMNAINAGVDCMEHGFILDDTAVQMMVERGMWLVPTLMASTSILIHKDLCTEPEFLRKAELNSANMFDSFKRAYDAGVKCALGTDCGSILCSHDNTAMEMVLMVERCGLTPAEALKIGTINSAELCDVAESLGSVTVGKKAHFAVLTDDPLKDIRATTHCVMTIKNGEVLWQA